MKLQNQDLNIELAPSAIITAEMNKLAAQSGSDFEVVQRDINGINFNVFKNLAESKAAISVLNPPYPPQRLKKISNLKFFKIL